MLSLQRYSFRQLLLVAFLLVAALLSIAAVRELYLLEDLLAQSSEGARQAVARTADAQVLAERTVSMERAARQFLVLDDPVLRQRFDEAKQDAAAALRRLADESLPSSLAEQWRASEARIERQLRGPEDTSHARELVVTASFRDLDSINEAIAEQVRMATEARNQVLMKELDSGRTQLGRQILAAIVVTIARPNVPNPDCCLPASCTNAAARHRGSAASAALVHDAGSAASRRRAVSVANAVGVPANPMTSPAMRRGPA